MIDFDSANHIVEGRRGGCIIRSTASATLSMDDENGRLRKAVEAFDVSVAAVTEILAAMCDAALATITRLHEEGKRWIRGRLPWLPEESLFLLCSVARGAACA